MGTQKDIEITVIKKKGDNSHFFANFKKKFNIFDNSENTFHLKFQNVSDNKYLKTYKIDSKIFDYDTPSLENSLEFTHESEESFFNINASVYEDLESIIKVINMSIYCQKLL